MIIDYFRQGVSNLTHRSLRSVLTMVGIFIGVALVVALISLGEGMQEAIIGQFSSLGADTLTIQAAGGGFGPPGSYQSVTIGEKDLKAVKRVQGVDGAFGRMIAPVKVTVHDQQEFSYIATIADKPDEYRLSLEIPTPLSVSDGRMIKPGETGKVVIGNSLHTKAQLGRKLNVGDKIDINGQKYDVVGVLEKTGNPQLDIVLWVSLKSAQEITGKDNFGIIAAKVQKGADVATVKDRVERALRRERDVKAGKEDFTVQSSQELIDSLNSVLGAVKWFLVGIATISLLVGGVGITNTMYTSVLERTREIGIMKAIGATNGDVLILFLIESGLLGVLGGIIGIGIGAGLAATVAAIAKTALGTSLIQAHLSWTLLGGAVLGSFLVGSIAGITPARQASRLKPVEALQRG